MVECQRCHKKFDWQYLLDKHLARKFPCKEQKAQRMEQKAQRMEQKAPIGKQCEFCLEYFTRLDKHTCKMECDGIRILEKQLNIKIDYIPKDKCRFCDCNFSRTAHLTRHQLTCKSKIDYKEQLEKQLEEKHARLTPHTINNTTNNNINTTNNITINLRPFGKENMEYITREVILKLCQKANFRNEIIPRLVKQVHCNPEHPENHNLLVTNLRAPYAKVYDGEEYVVDTSKDIIDKVMDNVTDRLTDAYTMENDDGKFNKYEKAITRLEEDIADQDSKFKREQRTKVKRNMYNNQKIIEKTKRSLEESV
jgi:hypothetical protein